MYTDNVLIPEQRTGIEKNFEHSIVAPDCDAADEFFLIAKDRLLHPGKWHSVSEDSLTDLVLTDSHAHDLTRAVRKGDYIRTRVAGSAGEDGVSGSEWLHIEGLIYDTDPDADAERISIQVRPCSPPDTAGEVPHHFFGAESTSTFVVSRIRCELKAAIHIRNHGTVLHPGSRTDSVPGFSALSWNGLLKGLLHFENV